METMKPLARNQDGASSAGHFLTSEFAKFVVCGAVAAALHWVARYALSQWMVFSTAVLIAYFVGMAVAFALNRTCVFPGATTTLAQQTTRFVATNLAFLPVVWLASLFFANTFFPYVGITWGREGLSHGIAVALPTVITFFIHKFFTFSK
jgi:putative flippase GtrA